MSIQRRAFSGILAGAANFVVTFALTLAQVPILLNYWGAQLYGSWNAIFALYSLSISLEAGHQSYLGAIFVQKMHQDRNVVRISLGSGLRMACLLGTIQLIFCAVLFLSEAARSTIGVDTQGISKTETILSLLALVVQWVLAGSIGGILVKVCSAGGHYTRAVIWGIVHRILFTVALCGGAVATGRILPAAVAVACVITLSTSLQLWDLRRLFPDIFPWWGAGTLRQGWENFCKSVSLTISGAVQQLAANGLVLLVTHFLDTIAAALLTTMRTLANTAMQATLVVVQPVLPDLIRYHMARDGIKVAHTLAGLWFISGAVVNLGLAAAIAVAPPFYQYWTRDKLPYDPALFAMLAAGIQIRNISFPFLIYLNGLNHLGAQMRVSFGQTAGTLAVCLMTIGLLGVKGAGLGIVVGEIIASVICYRAIRQALAPIGLVLTLRHLFFPLFGLLLVVAGYGADLLWEGHSIMISTGVVVGLLVLAAANWMYLPMSVRTRMLSMLPTFLRSPTVFGKSD